MPNWCYNTTSIDVDNELFFITKDLLNAIKYKNKTLPEDIKNKILTILFNYREDFDEDAYVSSFIEELNDELCIGSGEDYFNYDTRWGPPTDTLVEISERFPFIKITNEYYSTADDYEGTDIILNGKYLLNESFTTSEKLWEENGHNCKDYLLDNIINNHFKIIEEDDKVIKFEKNKIQSQIWPLRTKVVTQQVENSYLYKFDISLPLNNWSIFLNAVKIFHKDNASYEPYFFGHLGDGNLHCSYKINNANQKKYQKLENFIYQLVIKLGGSIAAEHGLGYSKNHLIKKYKSRQHFEILNKIKSLFDKDKLLNRNKLIKS